MGQAGADKSQQVARAEDSLGAASGEHGIEGVVYNHPGVLFVACVKCVWAIFVVLSFSCFNMSHFKRDFL